MESSWAVGGPNDGEIALVVHCHAAVVLLLVVARSQHVSAQGLGAGGLIVDAELGAVLVAAAHGEMRDESLAGVDVRRVAQRVAGVRRAVDGIIDDGSREDQLVIAAGQATCRRY